MTRRAIFIFVLLAVAVSWAMQFAAIGVFGLGTPGASLVFLLIMWSPTLLAAGFLILHRPSREGVLWRLGRLRYLPIGIAVETALGFAVVGLLVAAGLAVSGWFVFGAEGVAVSGGPWLLGRGEQAWPLFLLNIVLTAVAFSVMNLVAATGEEFAWRGFLQGHLTRQFGVRPGILVLAAIWTVWHFPALLAGYNFPEHPYLGAFVLFPLQMIGASLFFGWLTIRSGSFWPAALAHGAVNSIQQGVVGNLGPEGSALHADVLLTALMALVGLFCWFALGDERRTGRPDQRKGRPREAKPPRNATRPLR
ncbi:CPBP family intramembrane glutamic endopeptidase [Brevundimonas sp. Root1423]|uniref:CPBP family intramembrane glutamic endopeptidase n=1 Tax=Brevundimonas sp. Root1423 TaxID=1736462 RepID=UPI0006FBF72E|nr:CPBP family intramembrane glutamic endopeptidase [Brevundimonas sp. Root1423]KQY89786.1 hypothetical protein ASD25_04450 [Brevundimonas sp. Root1423]